MIVRASTDFQKIFDLLAERGVGIGAAGVHAGYAETSEMLECQPDLVHMDAAVPGRCDEDFYKPENISRSQMQSFLEGIETQSPIGVLGDPTGATAEAGRKILELLARGVAANATASTPEPAAAETASA